MKNPIQAAFTVKERFLIELDPRIIKQARLKDGSLFQQELTPEGDILLKRLEDSP